MRALLVYSLISLLAACASKTYPISSPYYFIPTGSRIELHQTLTIPPNSASLYMQYGKVVTPKERDQYHANCWFLSWKMLETPQTIKPDTFIVTRSVKSQDYVLGSQTVKLASNGRNTRIGAVAGDSSPIIEYVTELYIHSDKQPDIRRLACSHWDDPIDDLHLTVEQIQNTLGKIATIEINK